jgi:hypothetical protein
MNKIIIIFIISLLLLGNPLVGFAGHFNQTSVSKNNIIYSISQYKINNETSLIENYTWAVLRYDHPISSINHGDIKTTFPSSGTVLIPTNMMSYDVIKVALQIYADDKMQILNNLVKYDEENLKHSQELLFNWDIRLIMMYTFRKEAGHEMFHIGEKKRNVKLIGDCYAQASFNTAVLRLCGFSDEEVFNVLIPGHVVNAVKINDTWWVLDSTYAQSVRLNQEDSILFKLYDKAHTIRGIENDRYYVYFGYSYGYFHLANNMNNTLLHRTMEGILPSFGNPKIGIDDWDLDLFTKNISSSPHMLNVSFQYTVDNVKGGSIDEKAYYLSDLNYQFVVNQSSAEDKLPNQYNRALYAFNLINVTYPQAYANAAKYAAKTSYFGDILDARAPAQDIRRTFYWVNFFIKTKNVLDENQIAFSDFTYLLGKGSTIDKAVVAYGTLRNMIMDTCFWSPDDLYILITNDYQGYLAINYDSDWKYLSFGKERSIQDAAPENIIMVFNENDYFDSWTN